MYTNIPLLYMVEGYFNSSAYGEQGLLVSRMICVGRRQVCGGVS